MTNSHAAHLLARMEALEEELVRLRAIVDAAAADAAGSDDALRPAAPAADLAASRRDLLRYGAVALGAAAAGLAPRPALAANGDPVLVGGNHTGTAPTTITINGIGANNFAAIHGSASASSGDNFGVWGETNSTAGAGLVGNSNAETGFNAGVYGEAVSTAGAGVVGNAIADTGVTAGVVGWCTSPAGTSVRGLNSNGGTAILGEIPGTTAANGIALYGLNNSAYAGPGPGAGGFGVYGLSARGHGLVGATAAAGAAALVGATNGVAGAYAGAFYGPVVIVGDVAVTGAKSAAVPFPDGSRRRLYCLECPESWFEDFGTGRLQCGRADVRIDPGFAAVADLSDYHVFVTVYDQHHDLMVTDRTVAGFSVAAKDEGSAGTFSWRVVARRRDVAGERLAPVAMPAEPDLPSVAEADPTVGLPGAAARLRGGRRRRR